MEYSDESEILECWGESFNLHDIKKIEVLKKTVYDFYITSIKVFLLTKAPFIVKIYFDKVKLKEFKAIATKINNLIAKNREIV